METKNTTGAAAAGHRNTGGTARLLYALLQYATPLTAQQLGAAAGVDTKDISSLLRYSIAQGVVIRRGGPRSASYALSAAARARMTTQAGEAPAPLPQMGRTILCRCCGQTRPRLGFKRAPETGPVCAECLPDLEPSAPKAVQRSPEGRPPNESVEPWRPSRVTPPPTPPAESIAPADLPPGVKVTIRPRPLGRHEVPADFRGGFCAEWEMLRDGGRA